MTEWLSRWLLPIGGIALTLGLWLLLTRFGLVSQSVLPSPGAVGGALFRGWFGGLLWPHIGFTLGASVLGAAIGCFIGIGLGLLVGESQTAHRFLYPVLAGLQSMPAIAVAPLLMLWMGLGAQSKVALVALSCIPPLFVSTAAGVASTPSSVIDLYRVFGANRWRTLIQVKLPCALDYVFSGLQVATVLSFVNCVVAEFIASDRGLGYLIKTYSSQLDVALVFAAIVNLALLGALSAGMLRCVHGRLVHWRR